MADGSTPTKQPEFPAGGASPSGAAPAPVPDTAFAAVPPTLRAGATLGRRAVLAQSGRARFGGAHRGRRGLALRRARFSCPSAYQSPSPVQLAAPSVAHWLGTDLNGRDLLYRVFIGARISLVVGLAGALVSLFVGTSYGLVAGYAGGRPTPP